MEKTIHLLRTEKSQLKKLQQSSRSMSDDIEDVNVTNSRMRIIFSFLVLVVFLVGSITSVVVSKNLVSPLQKYPAIFNVRYTLSFISCINFQAMERRSQLVEKMYLEQIKLFSSESTKTLETTMTALKGVQARMKLPKTHSEEIERVNYLVETYEFQSEQYIANRTAWTAESALFKNLQSIHSELTSAAPAHLKSIQEQITDGIALKLCALFGLSLLYILVIGAFVFTGTLHPSQFLLSQFLQSSISDSSTSK